MDTPNSTRPLMENNPYPVLDNQPKPQPLAQQPQPNLMNPYAQAPYSQPNQGYSPNQQQYQPNGPINYPNQGQQPYVLNPYPEQRQQQGFQPAPYGQYVPPPPPVQVQVIKLPQYVTQAHRTFIDTQLSTGSLLSRRICPAKCVRIGGQISSACLLDVLPSAGRFACSFLRVFSASGFPLYAMGAKISKLAAVNAAILSM